MVGTLEQTKRAAIAEKLADMRAIQNLIVSNEEIFINECNDQEIRDRLQDMLEDDRKNSEILETIIVEFGIQSKPKENVEKMVNHALEMAKSSEPSLFAKMAHHELLKHGQVMSGLIVHKAVQVSEMDMKQPLAPLNTLNFDNRAHQEQLKGILEILGTRELTGKEPEQGIWGRVQDAFAAATGVVGSAVTRTTDELGVLQIIRNDHLKTKTLINEIRSESNESKLKELFSQLYADLTVHSEAEEQVVYPKVRSFYDNTQELYDEQAELKKVLNEVKNTSPSAPEFKAKIKQIKRMVDEHTDEEESDMFSKARQNLSDAERNQLGREFKEAKKQLQIQMSS